jgi:hypothetical protein
MDFLSGCFRAYQPDRSGRVAETNQLQTKPSRNKSGTADLDGRTDLRQGGNRENRYSPS